MKKILQVKVKFFNLVLSLLLFMSASITNAQISTDAFLLVRENLSPQQSDQVFKRSVEELQAKNSINLNRKSLELYYKKVEIDKALSTLNESDLNARFSVSQKDNSINISTTDLKIEIKVVDYVKGKFKINGADFNFDPKKSLKDQLSYVERVINFGKKQSVYKLLIGENAYGLGAGGAAVIVVGSLILFAVMWYGFTNDPLFKELITQIQTLPANYSINPSCGAGSKLVDGYTTQISIFNSKNEEIANFNDGSPPAKYKIISEATSKCCQNSKCKAKVEKIRQEGRGTGPAVEDAAK